MKYQFEMWRGAYELPENYHPTLQSLSDAELSSSLARFPVLVHSHSVVSVAWNCLQEKQSSDITTSYPVLNPNRQVRDGLQNRMDHLAVREPHISLRSRRRPKTELKEWKFWPHNHQVIRDKSTKTDYVNRSGGVPANKKIIIKIKQSTTCLCCPQMAPKKRLMQV